MTKPMIAGATLALLAALVAGPVLADESKVMLKDGPGRDVVMQNCVGCHSLDYIPMNSVFLDEKGWQAEVGKMIGAYGAPVDEADKAKIVEYLVSQYGKK